MTSLMSLFSKLAETTNRPKCFEYLIAIVTGLSDFRKMIFTFIKNVL